MKSNSQLDFARGLRPVSEHCSRRGVVRILSSSSFVSSFVAFRSDAALPLLVVAFDRTQILHGESVYFLFLALLLCYVGARRLRAVEKHERRSRIGTGAKERLAKTFAQPRDFDTVPLLGAFPTSVLLLLQKRFAKFTVPIRARIGQDRGSRLAVVATHGTFRLRFPTRDNLPVAQFLLSDRRARPTPQLFLIIFDTNRHQLISTDPSGGERCDARRLHRRFASRIKRGNRAR